MVVSFAENSGVVRTWVPPPIEITGRRQDGATLARPPCRDGQPEPSSLPLVKNTEFFFLGKKVSQNLHDDEAAPAVRAAVSWFVRRIGKQADRPAARLVLSERVAERNEIPAGARSRGDKQCYHRYQVTFAICNRNCLHYFSFSWPPTIFSKEPGVCCRCGLRSSRSFPWLVFFLFPSSFFSRARALYRCYPLAILVILVVNIVIFERGLGVGGFMPRVPAAGSTPYWWSGKN